MPILSFKIFQYRLPLGTGLTIPGKALREREGLLLVVNDENGHRGYGDISPLPGLNAETITTARAQLVNLCPLLRRKPFPPGIENLDGKIASWLSEESMAPSVRFGVESAVLTLKAGEEEEGLAALLQKNSPKTVAVSGLLQGATAAVVAQAADLVAGGFQSLKLKVGETDFKKDIEKVNAVSDAVGGKAILRLDANRAWDLREAVEFARRIDFAAVEYIEEPLKDISGLPAFYAETLIPVAVDESVLNSRLEDLKSLDGVEIVILKPTALGGLERTSRLARQAKGYGLRPVISSSFESGVGIRILANIASAFSRNVPAGLDTLKWFDADVITEPLTIRNGHLDLSRCQCPGITLNPAVLTEIPL